MVIRTQQHILALTVNRPPKRNLNFLSEFSESLSIALVKYMHREIQLGDFNLHVNDCSESRAVKFMDFVTSPTCEECHSQPWKYTGPSFYKGYWCWCFIYFTGSSFIIIFQRFSMYSKSSEPDTYTYIDTTARSILAECLPVILDSCSANSVSLNNLTDNLNSALLKTLDSYNQKIHLDEISAMVFRWHSNRLVESLASGGVWQNKRFFTLPGKYKHSFPVLGQHISLNWNSNKKIIYGFCLILLLNSYRIHLPIALHSMLFWNCSQIRLTQLEIKSLDHTLLRMMAINFDGCRHCDSDQLQSFTVWNNFPRGLYFGKCFQTYNLHIRTYTVKIFNKSLSMNSVPSAFKTAIIKLLLSNLNINLWILNNY